MAQALVLWYTVSPRAERSRVTSSKPIFPARSHPKSVLVVGDEHRSARSLPAFSGSLFEISIMRADLDNLFGSLMVFVQ